MKITKSQLRKIIREEVNKELLREQSLDWDEWVMKSQTPEELEQNLMVAHEIWTHHSDESPTGMRTPESDDRAWGRSLSGLLEKMPGGEVRNALQDVIDDLVLTKLGGSGGKKMGPQLYALSHPRNRRD
tara:strand:- start:404 stop:790 length:387 start_codon:yes stop_codon:yes gene_type:complete